MLQEIRNFAGSSNVRGAVPAIVVLCALVISACKGGTEDTATSVTQSETPTSDASKAPAAQAGAAAAGGSDKYSVTVGVPSGSGKIGAIQFNVTTKSSGGFDGMRDKVACENVSGAAMLACNNKGSGGLSCAAIDPEGIALPSPLVKCGFSVDGALAAADFEVEVVDASNPDMEAVEVDVAVTEIAKAN